MKITNKHNLPGALVSAVDRFCNSKMKFDGYRVTSLIRPIQISVLEARHDSKIEVDASEFVWALFGTAAHRILEGFSGASAFSEERLAIDIDGKKISGQTDNMDFEGGLNEGGTLDDYKFTSTFAVKNDKPEWTAQANIYKFLWIKNGFRVSRLRIIAFLKDWFKSRAERDPDYPQTNVAVINIGQWPEEKTEAYIRERVNALNDAQNLPGGELPQCSDADRWAVSPTFAAMKEGRKTALRVLPTKEEADKWLKDYVSGKMLSEKELAKLRVEERAGDPWKRCASWCRASGFCAQYNPSKSGG